tara:strand:- start:955 stop:1815 length:861 start_codon:yes stop_codon:yes gene_type:complete
MLKVKLYGAKEYWCQVPRLKQGFLGLGCEVVKGDNFDFVYCNNFDFDSKDSEHKNSAISNDGFKIFNVLDIPPHIPDFPIDKLKEQLSQADIVTCISEPVKEQLANIGVEATVIWNPIKDVSYDPQIKREIDCLYVGRSNDPNKRYNLLERIEKYVVGPTGGSPTGKYLGLVSDVVLNQLYNSAKIVALPSKFEGLGLPALEAMACGAVPLVCSDNPNSKLCPDFCVCKPTVESVTATYNGILNHFTHFQSVILNEWSSWVAFTFSKFTVAQNIINVYKKKRGIQL